MADVPGEGREPFSLAAPTAMRPLAGRTIADLLAIDFREAGYGEIVTVSTRELDLRESLSVVLE